VVTSNSSKSFDSLSDDDARDVLSAVSDGDVFPLFIAHFAQTMTRAIANTIFNNVAGFMISVISIFGLL